ncbi:MAG: hypothetical protein WAW90_02455 [Minisyncoccia bacterium]
MIAHHPRHGFIQHYKNSAGFTLVETVIVVGMSACMMIAISALVLNFNKTLLYGNTSNQSFGSASALMREIESLTLPANAILQTHTFGGATYISTSTSLVLEIPSIDSSGNVIANTYDYAAFYVVGTTSAYRLLQPNALSTRASSTKLLSSTLNSMTFSFSHTDFTQVSSTTVDIQTRAQVKQDIISDHQRELIRLRNH